VSATIDTDETELGRHMSGPSTPLEESFFTRIGGSPRQQMGYHRSRPPTRSECRASPRRCSHTRRPVGADAVLLASHASAIVRDIRLRASLLGYYRCEAANRLSLNMLATEFLEQAVAPVASILGRRTHLSRSCRRVAHCPTDAGTRKNSDAVVDRRVHLVRFLGLARRSGSRVQLAP
jgi:hypothetical protein